MLMVGEKLNPPVSFICPERISVAVPLFKKLRESLGPDITQGGFSTDKDPHESEKGFVSNRHSQNRRNWRTRRKSNSSKEDYYLADSFEQNHNTK